MVDYLIKDEKEVKSFVTNYGQGKIAILNYQVIKHLKGTTYGGFLETGRHHQIRVQFASAVFPSWRYALWKFCQNAFSFICFKLEFPHPVIRDFNLEVKPKGSLGMIISGKRYLFPLMVDSCGII